MSVWELYTQLFAMNWTCERFARGLSQGCAEKIRKKDVVMTAGRLSSWSIQILRWKLGQLLWPRNQETEFPVEVCGLSQTQEGQKEQIHPQTLIIPFFNSTGMIYMYWVPAGQTVNKEYYVEVLREFKKRFGRKRPALFKSSQWHFHQDNAPVHNSILDTDYLTKMGIKTVRHSPYSRDLAPCDFWLFPKLGGCRYETIEKMKEAVTKVIDTLTQEYSMGPSISCWNCKTSALQPEEITSKGTRVSCLYYQ